MPHEPSHAAVQDTRCSHVRSGISLALMTVGGEVHYDDARRVLGSLSSPNAVVHAFIAATHAQLGSSADAERAASLFVSTARPLIDAAGAPMAYWREAQPAVPFSEALVCGGLAALAGAAAESIPSRLNDNLLVGIAAAIGVVAGKMALSGHL